MTVNDHGLAYKLDCHDDILETFEISMDSRMRLSVQWDLMHTSTLTDLVVYAEEYVPLADSILSKLQEYNNDE